MAAEDALRECRDAMTAINKNLNVVEGDPLLIEHERIRLHLRGVYAVMLQLATAVEYLAKDPGLRLGR